VLAGLLRRQPLSAGKVKLAWQVVAGPQLARAATAELEEPATVRLHPKDSRWAVEIDRSRSALLARLRELLNLPTLDLKVGGHSAPEPGTRNPEP